MFVLLMLIGVWILGVEFPPNASVILSICALGCLWLQGFSDLARD